jgi:hypothetical protein
MKVTGGLKLFLQRLTAPTSYWYNGTAHWTDDPSTYTLLNITDGSPQTWNISLNSPYVVDNASYRLRVIPVDNANQDGTPATRDFVFDKLAATGQITSPSGSACGGADACIKTWPTLSGTFQDPGTVAPPTLSQSSTTVRIKRLSDNTYWNGASFGAVTEFVPGVFGSAGSPPTFTWSTATRVSDLDMLNDGVKYSIIARSKDKAGNDMGDGTDESKMASFTVLFDTSAPTSFLVQPSSGQVYMAMAQLTGTARDYYDDARDAGLDHIEISIRYPKNDVCWSEIGRASCRERVS